MITITATYICDHCGCKTTYEFINETHAILREASKDEWVPSESGQLHLCSACHKKLMDMVKVFWSKQLDKEEK